MLSKLLSIYNCVFKCFTDSLSFQSLCPHVLVQFPRGFMGAICLILQSLDKTMLLEKEIKST